MLSSWNSVDAAAPFASVFASPFVSASAWLAATPLEMVSFSISESITSGDDDMTNDDCNNDETQDDAREQKLRRTTPSKRVSSQIKKVLGYIFIRSQIKLPIELIRALGKFYFRDIFWYLLLLQVRAKIKKTCLRDHTRTKPGSRMGTELMTFASTVQCSTTWATTSAFRGKNWESVQINWQLKSIAML